MDSCLGSFAILLGVILFLTMETSFFSFIIPIFFLLIIGYIFTSVIQVIESNKYEKQENLLEEIDNMSGQEFELLLIEKLLPLQGYTNINGTSYTGDYGIDIIALKNGIKCAIQCKRFNNKVGNKAIQEVVAGRKHYKCEKAIVITNNYYTNNAKTLAFDNKVELLDRDDVIKMIKEYKKH